MRYLYDKRFMQSVDCLERRIMMNKMTIKEYVGFFVEQQCYDAVKKTTKKRKDVKQAHAKKEAPKTK